MRYARLFKNERWASRSNCIDCSYAAYAACVACVDVDDDAAAHDAAAARADSATASANRQRPSSQSPTRRTRSSTTTTARGLCATGLASLMPLLRLGAKGFAAEVGGWLLVGQLPDEQVGWAYRTTGVSTATAVRAPTGEVEAMFDDAWAAFAVRKRPQSPFHETIFIGRATSNDVCIPHTSVSKLHARARYIGEALALQDANSSNGTTVNGDVDVTVDHGDLVRFGNVVFQCFEPVRFHSVLGRYRASRGR